MTKRGLKKFYGVVKNKIRQWIKVSIIYNYLHPSRNKNLYYSERLLLLNADVLTGGY